MTADSIRRMAIEVIAEQQAYVTINSDKDSLLHLFGFNNGVLTLAEQLIGSLVESQSIKGGEE